MSLNENTTVQLSLKSLVALGGVLISLAVWLVSHKMEFDKTKDSLENVRNRVWVIEHPNHPWSIRYKENHQDD